MSIDYQTHSLFMKYCALVLLSGFILLLLGIGWMPIIASVLGVLGLSAFVCRYLR
jgi:hypothetical protein